MKKPHPLKGRKLTPEQIASRAQKTAATRQAKLLAQQSSATITPKPRKAHAPHSDAITYLKHAEIKVYERLRKGSLKTLDESHMLMILALRTLENDTLENA